MFFSSDQSGKGETCDPEITIEDGTERNCTDFEKDGYKCAPFFACKGGEIIINGKGFLHIRSTDPGDEPKRVIKSVMKRVALDPSLSKVHYFWSFEWKN